MDRLEAIPECLDKHQTPENGGKFLNKINNNSFNRDPLFLQFLDKSPIVEVAEATHGDDCHCIGMQSWLTGPGRPDQGLHTDWLPVPTTRRRFVPIHASKSLSSSPPPITISMTCPKSWDRRSLFRAAIFPAVPQAEQPSGITGVKRVSYAMLGM